MKTILFFIIIALSLNSFSKSQSDYYFKGMKFLKDNTSNIEKRFDINLKIYGLNNEIVQSNETKNKIENLYLSFGSHKKLNIKEARKLLVECSEYILSLVNNNPKIKDHLSEFPFNYKNLKIHINFYDKSENRLSDGNISYCFLHEGQVFLTSLNQDFFAKEKIQETYEEALKKSKIKL